MPEPEQKPDGFANKKKDVIIRFSDAYGPALLDARVSAEHTATQGFQKLVEDHLEGIKARRRGIAARLHEVAKFIEDFGPSADTEKYIQDEKKLVVELLGETEAFFVQVSKPVQAAVEECKRIVTAHQHEADRDERSAPLHNAGLVELLRGEIAQVAKPHWDQETHRVVIKEPA